MAVRVMASILFALLACIPLVAVLSSLMSPSWSARLVVVACWVSVGAFVVALPTAPGGIDFAVGSIEFGLRFTPLALLWSVAVLTVGAVIITFARRYLHGDPVLPTITVAFAGVMVSIVFVVAANDVATIMLGWLATGSCYLMAFGLSGGRRSVAVLVRAFLVGDGLIAAAFLLIIVKLGNVTISQLVRPYQLGDLTIPIALLLSVGVLVRSAQGPFLRWLGVTVDAPTPVSALLHAGVINGGMIVILRLAPIVFGSQLTVWLLGGVGGLTAVAALAIARYRGDYKGKLVLSTSAQMGFVLVELAVGAFVLALVHLILHACYKAWLFLSSSSQIASARPIGSFGLGSPWSRGGRLLFLSSLTALAAASATVIMSGGRVSLVVVVLSCFAFATSFAYIPKSLADKRGFRKFVGTCVGVVVAFATLGAMVRLITNYVSASLPTAYFRPISPLWLLVVGVGVVILTIVMRNEKVRVCLCAMVEADVIDGKPSQEPSVLGTSATAEPDDLRLAG